MLHGRVSVKNGRDYLEIGMELESLGGSLVVESEICIPATE